MPDVVGLQALSRIASDLGAFAKAGSIPGAVAIIWRGDELVQRDVAGQRDIEAGLPMEGGTIFRIASMTKPITTLAALMLIEENKLAFDDQIRIYVPELAHLSVLRSPAGPLEDTSPPVRPITIEDLMTHRAGFAYSFTSSGQLARAYETALGPSLGDRMAPDAWLTALGKIPLAYQPGERFCYGPAIDILGFVIARIEGRPLGEVLKTRIFDPLGMADTGFHVPKERQARLAKLYERSGNAHMSAVAVPTPAEPPAFEGGGGGLFSTAGDYLKFARLMKGQGALGTTRLAEPSTIEMMTANRLTGRQHRHDFLGLPMWRSQGFGLGTAVVVDEAGHRTSGVGAVGSFGWPGAFGTWWQVDPVNDLILIYMTQVAAPIEGAALGFGRTERANALSVFQELAYAAVTPP